MIRRRRPKREIAFSFDSFLDVVANVVGIILRLILVAWVGVRGYHIVVDEPDVPAPPAAVEEEEALPEPTDPLAPENERRRRKVDLVEGKLRDEAKQVEPLRQQRRQAAEELEVLRARRQALAAERKLLERTAADRGATGQALALSLQELSARSKRLLADLDAVRKAAPAQKKALRYRTPVSQPVTEEVMFECLHGRVTLLDVGALTQIMRQDMRSMEERLRYNWEARGVTSVVGAFRLRYVVERQRSMLDANSSAPLNPGGFSYSANGWEAEPVVDERGESANVALTPSSAFRRVVDALEPRQTAVTLWVYEDSFPLYRRLRDYLHDRDIVVAGRPMPLGASIASSRSGTGSRGQ